MTIRAILPALLGLVIGWSNVPNGTTYAWGAAPAYPVVLPGDLPDDVAVTDASPIGLTVAPLETTVGPALDRELYAGGAWLVLPAGLPGCCG